MVKRKVRKSSNFDKVFPRAPSGSLFKDFFLVSPQSKVDLVSDDLVPKSKSDSGPVSVLGPVVSPGSNLGSVSVSGANAPTDILACEMKRDPAFALAVSSLERCLRVRERVGSSLIVGRPGKPPGSGGFDAAVCEKESKGLVSDSQGIGNDPFSCAVAPVEVVRRSGAVGAGVALCAATVTASSASVACKDPRVSSGGAETAHVTAVESKSINGLLEGPESDFSKNLAESTAAHAT